MCVFPESQWRERKNAGSSVPAETDGVSQKHIEILSQICSTHLRYTWHSTTGSSHELKVLCTAGDKQERAWTHTQPFLSLFLWESLNSDFAIKHIFINVSHTSVHPLWSGSASHLVPFPPIASSLSDRNLLAPIFLHCDRPPSLSPMWTHWGVT